MSTLANDVNEDLYLPDGSNLMILNGIDGIVQNVRQATKMTLGEDPYDTSNGVDYMGTIFASSDPEALDYFRLSLAQNAAAVSGVTNVGDIDITKSNDVLSFTLSFSTIYGPASIVEAVTVATVVQT